jgi:hypothetical protein
MGGVFASQRKEANMKRYALVVGVLAAIGVSAPAMADDLQWVNGAGDASGHWRSAEYALVNGRPTRIDTPSDTARIARPKLSYEELVQESESDSLRSPEQPRYRLEGRRLALQNPAPSAPRERVTLPTVERLYRDFATG